MAIRSGCGLLCVTSVNGKRSEARLLRQLQEVTVLHEISSAGTEAASIDDLIERATEIMGATIFSDYFGFNIYDKQKHWLFPHPSYRGITAEHMQHGFIRNLRYNRQNLLNWKTAVGQ